MAKDSFFVTKKDNSRKRKRQDDGIERNNQKSKISSKKQEDSESQEIQDEYAPYKRLEDIPTDDDGSNEDGVDEEDEDDDEGDDVKQNNIHSKINNESLSFGELVEMKKNGDVNNKNKFKKRKHIPTREDKNAPMIQSSKKTVSRFKEVLPTSSFKARDPRFDTISGKYDENSFKNRYKFVDGIREKEISVLKESMKKAEKEGGSGTEFQSELSRLQQIRQRDAQKEKIQKIKNMLRKVEKEKVANGKKPFFHKNSEIKKLELKERFDELDKSGKLNTFLQKKRKKNSNKDHRWLPERRNVS